MTKYLQPSFSVNLGGKEYSESWERIFGKKDDDDEPITERNPTQPPDDIVRIRELESTVRLAIEDLESGRPQFALSALRGVLR